MRTLPAMRPVDVYSVDVEGRRLVCLRDPELYAPEPLLLHPDALAVLALLDGQRSLDDVRTVSSAQLGRLVADSDVLGLVGELERLHYVFSPAFAEHRAAVDAAFRIAAVRPAAHAGMSYPDDPAALRTHLAGFFAGCDAAADGDGVCGLVAPHIDLRVGGAGYGRAYAALGAAAGARRFVILGTAHATTQSRFAVTTKDFATPLGPVATDRAFLTRLCRRAGADLHADELLHRNEHTIEFQALMLRHVLGDHGFRIVPVLAGALHDCIAAGRSPAGDPRVADFVGALRATIAEDDVPTVLIASVDLAHVGAKFGDPEGLAPALLAVAEAKDRELLQAVTAGDAEAFFAAVAADGDRTRVCGTAPLYAFLATLAGTPTISGTRGRLLHYDVARDDATHSAVTYASVAFAAEGGH
jgi:AmmeMemoRadiSam system protein B